MRTPRAVVGSTVFFLLAPGTVAGLIPWLLTGWSWRPAPAGLGWLIGPLRWLGLVLLLAGIAFVVAAFVRFVAEGRGTPAPVAPPTHLVVGGVYRYLRNPMYVAVLACIVGQALLLHQPVLWWEVFLGGAAMVAFARFYEEPELLRQFGAEYEAYRRAVPGWWPRLRPYRPQ